MIRCFSCAPQLILGAALVLGGCAAPQAPYRTPDHWSKDGYEWPPGSGHDQTAQKSEANYSSVRAKEVPRDPQTQTQPNPAPVIAGTRSRVETPEPTLAPMQKGRTCIRDLRKAGVKFRTLGDLKGVENPVEIEGGVIGGVVFWANDGRPLELDCRLALALHQLGPIFQKHGLTKARFSGAYQYRRTRSGRLSHHAHGLAIDLHDLQFGKKTLSVEDDFARGVGCQKKNPVMNRLACEMREQKLFEEFLDPDYNFDHRDHLHIAVPRRDQ